MSILIDFNNYIHASISASGAFENKRSTDDPIDVGAVRHLFLNSIRAIRMKFRRSYGEIVLCADGNGNWRRDFFPNYKVRRRKLKDNNPERTRAILAAIDTIRDECLENVPYPLVRVDGAEGDDVIAWLCLRSRFNSFGHSPGVLPIDEPTIERCLVASADRDLAQLVGFDTDWYNPRTAETRTDRDFDVSMWLEEHVIKGDAGDDVPNVFSDDDVFVTEGKRQTPATRKRVEALIGVDPKDIKDPELRRRVERNHRLINLGYVPAELFQRIEEEYVRREAALPPRSGLLKYFMRHRLSQLTERLNDF